MLTLWNDSLNNITRALRPLPSAPKTRDTIWKYSCEYFLPVVGMAEDFREDRLFSLFRNPEKRSQVNHKHVLCSLYHPGIGLDLIVIYGIRSKYDSYVIDHYAFSWDGLSRDRLYDTVLKAIETDYDAEIYIRATLNNKDSLLYKALEDHRYQISGPAVIGNNPDTLSKLQNYLRQRQLNRINQTSTKNTFTRT